MCMYKCIDNVFFCVCWQAEAITLTVAQAFNIAYEKWQAHKKKKEKKVLEQHGTVKSSEEEDMQLGKN